MKVLLEPHPPLRSTALTHNGSLVRNAGGRKDMVISLVLFVWSRGCMRYLVEVFVRTLALKYKDLNLEWGWGTIELFLAEGGHNLS